MTDKPAYWDDSAALADCIIDRHHAHIRLAIPLGLGKPNDLVNALFARACEDRKIALRIYTALTLEKPRAESELERRFLQPLNERLFANYVDLDYAAALRSGDIPDNIQVTEFFLAAGQWLKVAPVQHNYVSANYTDATEYILASGINVVAQMVAGQDHSNDTDTSQHLSLSCNPDITLSLLDARRRGAGSFSLIGQINDELPYMGGDAEIRADEFDYVLGGACAKQCLFNVPKQPVSSAAYAAGLHVSRLIPDGGTLQIGIGSIGDAIAHALILRHSQNNIYRNIIHGLTSVPPPLGLDHQAPFERGLYGASEMLVDTFLDLISAGVVKREVEGCVAHAAFFLGPKSMYRRLRELTPAERGKIGMTRVSFVNNAVREFERKQKARQRARFVNNALKATLLGAVVSDGLDSGQVISGVGGQLEFIQQAFTLEGARSIIVLNAVRELPSGAESNLLWNYGHQTIPRQLRDILVTEYGVADLRGKTDADVITAMLSVSDTRFQGALMEQAKTAGKLPRTFAPPATWQTNTPASLADRLHQAHADGHLPDYPFGTDFTDTEQTLLPALARLKEAAHSKQDLAIIALNGLRAGTTSVAEQHALERMGLARPSNWRERVYSWLLRGSLHL